MCDCGRFIDITYEEMPQPVWPAQPMQPVEIPVPVRELELVPVLPARKR